MLGTPFDSLAQRYQDPSFIVRNWTANDGLPVSGVSDLYQDEDGFVWLATLAGLARFDGARFRVFDTGSNPELPSNRITQFHSIEPGFYLLQTENSESLLFDGDSFLDLSAKFGFLRRSGTMSLGDGRAVLFTDSGILEVDRFGNGRFLSDEPLFAYGGIQTEDGMQWLGSPDGLIQVDPQGVRTVFTSAEGLPSNDVRGILPLGTELLIATPGGTGFYGAGSFRSVHYEDTPGQDVAGFFVQDFDGEKLISTSDGMRRLEGDQLVTDFSRGRFAQLDGAFMSALPVRDARGDLWYVFDDGLYRNDRLVLRRPGTFNRLFPSRSGGIWLAHNTEGLILILPSAVHTIGIPEGLPGQNAYGLAESPDGTMWVGLLDQSRFVAYRDGTVSRSFPMGEPWAVGLDADGTVWLGGERLCRVNGASCIPAEVAGFAPPVRAIRTDSNVNLWVGTQSQLWVRDRNQGVWSQVTPADEAPLWVRWIAEGPEATMFFGTFGKGLGYLQDGRLKHLDRSSGFPSNNIRSVLPMGPDEVWVGSEDSGLIILEGSLQDEVTGVVWTTIGRADGLPDNSIHAMVQDSTGQVWINSNQDIYRVDPALMRAFIHGGRDRLPITLINDKSGMRNREGNGGIQAAGFVDDSGLVHFPTQQGVSVVDPSLLQAEASLHVFATAITTPVRTVNVHTESIELDPDERNLEIEVSAPQFATPERMAFRYRMADETESWTIISADARIILTNLSPGSHQLEIQAGLSGNWSENTTVLRLKRRAAFLESVWFLIILVGFGIGTTALVFVGRVRLIRRRNEQLEDQIQDRTRTIQQQAERLAELDDLKSRFFSNISHELRTPLTLIKGPVSRLLQEHQGGEPSLERQLAVVDRNVDRLSTLVNEILDLTALEAGHFELNPQVGDLSAFVRHVSRYFVEAAADLEVDLTTSVPVAPVIWTFDARRMEHVLVNLIGNALKFSSQGGRIDVTLEADDGPDARITVSDSGSGIDEADLPHLFERYFRGSNREGIKGSGIGLAMSQDLVQLHGGTLKVESVKGQGSTFTVVLPRNYLQADGSTLLELPGRHPVAPAPSHQGISGEPVSESSSARATVLIAEDNPDLRLFLAESLVRDYHILTASDGQEALDLCRDTVPDLVVSDVMMPHLSGLELCEALKGDVATSHIPVIILTAKGDIDSKAEGLRTGADVYLGKPFETRELLAYIDSLLENRRRLQQAFRTGSAEPEAESESLVSGTALPDQLSSVDRVFLECTLAAMDSSLPDADLNVDSLADELNLSRRQFHRKIEALTGYAPGDLLRRKRVDAACRLLEHGSLSLKEVGTAVGFRSESGFRKAFKDQTGVAPSKWKA